MQDGGTEDLFLQLSASSIVVATSHTASHLCRKIAILHCERAPTPLRLLQTEPQKYLGVTAGKWFPRRRFCRASGLR